MLYGSSDQFSADAVQKYAKTAMGIGDWGLGLGISSWTDVDVYV